MKIFNGLVVILILVGLFVLGVFTVLYAFDVGDYQLATLPIKDVSGGVSEYLRGIESGNLDILDVITLAVIVLLGLVLLVLEFKPPAPRRVRMQRGTYTTRSAVKDEATMAAEQNPEVLQADADVKAQRRPGAKVDIRASVRPGQNVRTIQSEVREEVRRHLGQLGIPVSNLKVQIIESDPRQTKTRVK
ncbi:MAG: alkaline shock response membrane anchor protein AmaP [Actinomycetota bacterium]|jgi:uncharacterized alkaline shock family protein YloU|nr:alkaline shock response membrane anchor protein AmaP [Actinomycetota bacterium]